MRAVAVPVLLALLLATAACDSSGEKVDTRSTFPPDDLFARRVEGRVVQGAEIVPGAVVQLEARPGFERAELRDGGAADYLTTADLGGKFRILNTPPFYDLSVRKDREVVVFRGLGVWYFEPTLGSVAPLRGFTSRVTATTAPAPSVGNAIAFFVSGPEARAVSSESSDASSLVVTFRRFDTSVTLQAVEYVVSGGLATALRVGRADVRVTSGGAISAVVPMSALDEKASSSDVTFVAPPPPGFTPSTLEVVMDLGVRTSARPVARVAAGAPLRINVVRDARYFVHATATREGAISDSGLQYFNPFDKTVTLTLPPPVTEATFDGSVELSAAAGAGVVEHVLAPSSAGAVSLRIATADRATKVPDLIRLGLPRPAGRYSWTVQHFPTLNRIESFSGEDVRVVVPVSTTAPRVIELP